MRYQSVVVFLSLLYAVSANICCFPRQYEANQGLMKGTVKNGKLSILYGHMHYWYDAVSRRELFVEDLTVDGVETKVTVLKDYNITNRKYVISGNHCTQKSLTPFKEGCVPDAATKLLDSHLAMPDSGMDINTYDTSSGIVRSFLTVDKEHCFPVIDASAIATGVSEPYMQIVQFYNFTLGIKDESVFDIPKICHQPSPVG